MTRIVDGQIARHGQDQRRMSKRLGATVASSHSARPKSAMSFIKNSPSAGLARQ
jgi:hypothetical protein